jgi:hypothetical protein
VFADDSLFVLADALQARSFRNHFVDARAELVDQHSRLVKQLTTGMNQGGSDEVGAIRRTIRRVEGEIRHIDQMVDALNRRFPDDSVTAPWSP